MGLLTALLPGAGLITGGIKALADRRAADRQNQYAGEVTRWSPLTGMQPPPLQQTNPWGTILGTGYKGLELGMNLDKIKADALKDAEKKLTKGLSDKIISSQDFMYANPEGMGSNAYEVAGRNFAGNMNLRF